MTSVFFQLCVEIQDFMDFTHLDLMFLEMNNLQNSSLFIRKFNIFKIQKNVFGGVFDLPCKGCRA